MKQTSRYEGNDSEESKQPDPVWYFPATHQEQVTPAVRPDPTVIRFRWILTFMPVQGTFAKPGKSFIKQHMTGQQRNVQ